MGLFNRKQRVELCVFCGNYYDNSVFSSTIEDVDASRIYADTVIRSIREADATFTAVDCAQFHSEMMTLIRIEVFGLAWMHQFGDKHAAAQSAYTKSYLEERSHADIWDDLAPYNQAVARSSTIGQTTAMPSGRAYLAFVDSMRLDLFDQWSKQGFEPDAIARAANRFSTNVAWDKGITASFLMLTLCERLGYQLNEEGQFRLAAVIRGLYDGARETMKQVKVDV